MNVLIVDSDAHCIATGQRPARNDAPHSHTTDTTSLWQAIQDAKQTSVDLVLLEATPPLARALSLVSALKHQLPAVPVLVLWGSGDRQLILSAIASAVRSHSANVSVSESLLANALPYLVAPSCSRPARTRQSRREVPRLHRDTPARALSTRQQSVLKELLQGKSNKCIASELQITERTVKAHVSAIYRAIGVRSRAQAMLKAYTCSRSAQLQISPA
jgi:DNA-binding NarL/FixJ family response regulator